MYWCDFAHSSHPSPFSSTATNILSFYGNCTWRIQEHLRLPSPESMPLAPQVLVTAASQAFSIFSTLLSKRGIIKVQLINSTRCSADVSVVALLDLARTRKQAGRRKEDDCYSGLNMHCRVGEREGGVSVLKKCRREYKEGGSLSEMVWATAQAISSGHHLSICSVHPVTFREYLTVSIHS